MRELLQRAVAEIEKLPGEEQDAIAQRLLAEVEDGAAWEARFAGTTDEQWSRMVTRAEREIAQGETMPLDDFLATQPEEPLTSSVTAELRNSLPP